MSVGMFLGIRPSFLPDFQDEAEKFICEINSALRILGRPPYLEPRVLPNPYINGRFGRSSLDNNSAEALAALAAYYVDARCANLDILAANPYRIAFLPTHVSDPIETD